MKHILAAIDEDPIAESIVHTAGELAKLTGAALTVCHIMPDHIYRDIVKQHQTMKSDIHSVYTASMDLYLKTQNAWDDVMANGSPMTIDQAMSHAKAFAIQAASQLERMGMAFEPVGMVGHPAHDIVAYAAKHDVDMIVIGFEALHGLGKIRALGSVARKVLESANCPVLTVPLESATHLGEIQTLEANGIQ